MDEMFMCIGRIGFISELKKHGDSSYVNFTLYTNTPKYKRNEDGSKSKVDNTKRWSCTAWNGLAESFVKYKSVGDIIKTVGTLDLVDRDGKTYLNYSVDEIRYLPTPEKREKPLQDEDKPAKKEVSEVEALKAWVEQQLFLAKVG